MAAENPENKKFVSVRKALKELRVNEEELKKIVADGELKAYQDDESWKFDHEELEVYKTSQAYQTREHAISGEIDDEDLYASSDVSFDSLFSGNSTVYQEASLVAEIQDEGETAEVSVSHASVAINARKNNVTVRTSAIPEAKLRKNVPRQVINTTRRNRVLERKYYKLAKILAIVAIAAVTGIGYFFWALSSRPQYPGVRASRAIAGEFLPKILLTGEVVPKKRALVQAQTPGKVAESYFAENAKISSGDALFRVYSPTIENEIANTQLRLRQSELHLDFSRLSLELAERQIEKGSAKLQEQVKTLGERWKKNLAQEKTTKQSSKEIKQFLQKMVVSKQVSEQAAHQWLQLVLEKRRCGIVYEEVVAARKLLEQLEEQKKQLVIRAPMSGKLVRWHIAPQEYVYPGKIVAWIDDDSQLFIEGEITQANVRYINKNKPAEIKVETRLFSGKIVDIASTDGSMAIVRTQIDQTTDKVATGARATVELAAHIQKQCLQIPREAVLDYEDLDDKSQAKVFLLLKKKDHYTTHLAPVKLGNTNDEYVQIIEGLEEGMLVVTGPLAALRKLRDGNEVVVHK